MSEENKAIYEKANALFDAGDIEGFLRFCADDTEWTYVGDQTLKGKEAVRRYMAKTYAGSSNFRITNVIAENDWLTALGEITLKDEDGKETHYSVCDVWRFRDGKMFELKAFVIKT